MTAASAIPTLSNPALEASQPLIQWWSQQCVRGVTPMTRLQLAWMESMTETLQQEARFLAALSEAGQQLSRCYEKHGHDPAMMRECYQDIAREVADQHMQRLRHVASLPQDFKCRLWEEL